MELGWGLSMCCVGLEAGISGKQNAAFVDGLDRFWSSKSDEVMKGKKKENRLGLYQST